MAAANYGMSRLYDVDGKAGTITPKDTSAIQEVVEEDIRTVFNLPAASTIVPSTPMGRFVEWFTLCFASVQNVNVQNFQQLLISSAAGQQLDAIAQWFMLVRKPATATSASGVILRGEPGTVIPAGMKASNGNGDVFDLQEEVTIGSDGTATGSFVCEVKGPVACAEGDLVNIETAYLGLNSIYNPTAGSVGRNIETDDELRERIEVSRFSGIGFVGSIKNALEKIESVQSSIVLENNTGEPTSVDGVELDPHSILVCVDGITDANKAEVAEAVYNNKPCGTGYTHTVAEDNLVTIPHEDPYGNKYDVYVYKPTATEVNMTFRIKKRSYAGANLEADVKAALVNWVGADGTGGTKRYVLGEDVYSKDVIRAIEERVPGVIVVDAILNEGGTDPSEYSTANYVDVPGYSKAKFKVQEAKVVSLN